MANANPGMSNGFADPTLLEDLNSLAASGVGGPNDGAGTGTTGDDAATIAALWQQYGATDAGSDLTALAGGVIDVDALLAHEAVSKRVVRREVQASEKLARQLRQAITGDQEAIAALNETAHGQRALSGLREQMQPQIARQALLLVEGFRWLDYVQGLQQTDAYEFARVMGDPTNQQRLSQWAAKKAQMDGLRASGGQGQAGSRRQTYDDAGGDTNALYESFQRKPESKVLDDAVWDKLHPSNYEDMDDADAYTQMAIDYSSALSAAQANGIMGAARARTQAVNRPTQAARRAAAMGAPVITGGIAGGVDVDQIRAMYRRNPGDPQVRTLYEKYVRGRVLNGGTAAVTG